MGKFFAVIALVAFLYVGSFFSDFMKEVYLVGFCFGAATAILWFLWLDPPIEDETDNEKRP